MHSRWLFFSFLEVFKRRLAFVNEFSWNIHWELKWNGTFTVFGLWSTAVVRLWTKRAKRLKRILLRVNVSDWKWGIFLPRPKSKTHISTFHPSFLGTLKRMKTYIRNTVEHARLNESVLMIMYLYFIKLLLFVFFIYVGRWSSKRTGYKSYTFK